MGELILQLKIFGRMVATAVTNIFGWCLLFIFLMLIVLPLSIWKLFIVFLSKIVHPSSTIVSGSDSFFVVENGAANVKENPQKVQLNVGACLELEDSPAEIDFNQFVEHLQRSIIDNMDLQDYSWKLKSYLFQFCGYTFWGQSPDFCLKNHVNKVVLAPEQNFTDYLNTWIRMPYKALDSPLWEFLIVKHNMKEYVACKFHHSVADGLSVLQILGIVFKRKDAPTTPTPIRLVQPEGFNFPAKVKLNSF